MKIIHHFFFLTFLLSSAVSFGGGSVTWNEVKSVLDQRPEFAMVVYSTIIIATRVDEKFRSIELKFNKCLEDWCKAP